MHLNLKISPWVTLLMERRKEILSVSTFGLKIGGIIKFQKILYWLKIENKLHSQS